MNRAGRALVGHVRSALFVTWLLIEPQVSSWATEILGTARGQQLAREQRRRS